MRFLPVLILIAGISCFGIAAGIGAYHLTFAHCQEVCEIGVD